MFTEKFPGIFRSRHNYLNNLCGAVGLSGGIRSTFQRKNFAEPVADKIFSLEDLS
jgi:hypothetical protein